MSTNSIIDHSAVIPGALPLHALTLISLFTSPDGNTALLRDARGQVTRVKAGDVTGGLTILAISDEGLHLADARGKAFMLAIPDHGAD